MLTSFLKYDKKILLTKIHIIQSNFFQLYNLHSQIQNYYNIYFKKVFLMRLLVTKNKSKKTNVR